MSQTASTYSVVRNRPVARFRYKGSHSKPVRREIRIVAVEKDVITGYEVREGNVQRDLANAPIKSFSRSEMLDVERLSSRDAT